MSDYRYKIIQRHDFRKKLTRKQKYLITRPNMLIIAYRIYISICYFKTSIKLHNILKMYETFLDGLVCNSWHDVGLNAFTKRSSS